MSRLGAVPLDYDGPKGGTAQVALLRLPATGKAEGSLLINPGGPGGSGTSFVTSSLPLLKESPVAKRFDIVGALPQRAAPTRKVRDACRHIPCRREATDLAEARLRLVPNGEERVGCPVEGLGAAERQALLDADGRATGWVPRVG